MSLNTAVRLFQKKHKENLIKLVSDHSHKTGRRYSTLDTYQQEIMSRQ